MMVKYNRIWKYPIPVKDRFSLEMPGAAHILCVQVQNETPCIWVEVQPDNPTEIREFRLAGTGHEMTEAGRRYIGTFQLAEGRFVGHLFEIR